MYLKAQIWFWFVYPITMTLPMFWKRGRGSNGYPLSHCLADEHVFGVTVEYLPLASRRGRRHACQHGHTAPTSIYACTHTLIHACMHTIHRHLNKCTSTHYTHKHILYIHAYIHTYIPTYKLSINTCIHATYCIWHTYTGNDIFIHSLSLKLYCE